MKQNKSFGLSSNKSSKQSSSFLDDFLDEGSSKKENSKALKKVASPSEKLTRQTFMIKESILERLKDFVHTKRKYEDYNYSQRQAVEEALTELFKTTKIEERSK